MLSFNTSNISIMKIKFASNVCKYCMQNMNTLSMVMNGAHIQIYYVLCFKKIGYM